MANSPNWHTWAERDACMLLRSYFWCRFCNYSVVCGCLVALYHEKLTQKTILALFDIPHSTNIDRNGPKKNNIGWRERRVSDGQNWQPIVNDVSTPRHGLVAASVLLWASNKFEVKGTMLWILFKGRELCFLFYLDQGNYVWILFKGRELCCLFYLGEGNYVVNFI